LSAAASSFLDLTQRLNLDSQQWLRLRWQLLCELHGAAPAIVVNDPITGLAFDATKQVVAVQPAIRENMLVNSVPTPIDLPVIRDVPIKMPRAGGYTITFPIQAGDECMLVFQDQPIDSWWQSGGSGNNPMARRRHSLSDAIADFGIWSQPRVLSSYSTTGLQLRSDDGTRVIEITPSAINITVSSGSVSVNAPTVKLGQSPTKHLVFLEDLETLFNNHIHPDPQGGFTSAPTTTLTSSNGTTDTVAA